MIVDPASAVATIAAVVSTGCAVYVAWRDNSWRKHGTTARLTARLDAAERAAANWHETPPALKLITQVEHHGRQLADHTGTLKTVATKTDVAKIEGGIARVEQAADAAAAGVDRIENLLMKKALSA